MLQLGSLSNADNKKQKQIESILQYIKISTYKNIFKSMQDKFDVAALLTENISAADIPENVTRKAQQESGIPKKDS